METTPGGPRLSHWPELIALDSLGYIPGLKVQSFALVFFMRSLHRIGICVSGRVGNRR